MFMLGKTALHRRLAHSRAGAAPGGGDAQADARDRLARLRGLPCPSCRLRGETPLPLEWGGASLACGSGHGYSNPDVLMREAREAAGLGQTPRSLRGRTVRQ